MTDDEDNSIRRVAIRPRWRRSLDDVIDWTPLLWAVYMPVSMVFRNIVSMVVSCLVVLTLPFWVASAWRRLKQRAPFDARIQARIRTIRHSWGPRLCAGGLCLMFLVILILVFLTGGGEGPVSAVGFWAVTIALGLAVMLLGVGGIVWALDAAMDGAPPEDARAEGGDGGA